MNRRNTVEYTKAFPNKSLHLNIVSQSSCTGTQYLQAVGTAFGLQRDGNNGVCYVSSGEGTTSKGNFSIELWVD